jgi:hypothetical protein
VVVVAPPGLSLVALFIVFCIPGVVIVSLLLPQKDLVDHIILAVLTGVAFQIVYAYIISTGFHFSLVTVSVPSICLAVLFDCKVNFKPQINKKAFLIFIPAVLFSIATLNLVPGEDANFHLLALGNVTDAHAVPQAYQLYPEIPAVMYPLGFHVVTAQLQLFSGADTLIFGFASLVSGILCLSVYWCTKKLFSTECGLLAGALSVFATFPPLNSIILSTYANLLAYVFACASIGIIAEFDQKKHYKPLFLLSLMLAAGVETHLSFFLIVLPILIFLVTVLIHSGPHKVGYLCIPALSLALSAPFLTRISIQYTPYETGQFLSLWFDPLQLTPEMIPHQLGIWITLVSIPGLFLLKKHRTLFISWIGIFLFLALNTIMRIEFPLWYVFFATRMVDQLFLPVSMLGAFFLVTMWKFSKIGVFLLCSILLLSGIAPVLNAPRADKGVLFPTISPFFAADQQGMVWLQTTDSDAVILNEWWTATGSAWIPSLVNRRVVFPYIFSLEHYTDVLSIPERERYSFVIAAFPDSEEAQNYLEVMDVDYIFLSSYVLEEAKWRNNLWNPFVLQDSPNYHQVFQERYTYIFKVEPHNEYGTPYTLRDFHAVTVNPGDQYMLDVSLGDVSFPIDQILDIYVEDDGNGSFELRSEESILAVIPLINTQDTIHVAVRIPDNTKSITVSAKIPVTMTVSVSTAFRDSIPIGGNALVGTLWKKTLERYELKDQGHIYLFNTVETVEITYIDTGEGNIDFNRFIDGRWEKLTTVYRENDDKEKTILLDIPAYTVLDIGINVWGDPFILTSIHAGGSDEQTVHVTGGVIFTLF